MIETSSAIFIASRFDTIKIVTLTLIQQQNLKQERNSGQKDLQFTVHESVSEQRMIIVRQ